LRLKKIKIVGVLCHLGCDDLKKPLKFHSKQNTRWMEGAWHLMDAIDDVS
jgi:hypothetical protein